jgi:hypothetical protein
MGAKRAGSAGLIAVLVIGLGLIAAPAVFQMFTRAPGGGEMLDDFAPYMTSDVIGGFSDDLALIDRAIGDVTPAVDGVSSDVRTAYFADLAERWPGIYDDMGGMLTTMDANLGNFDAVRSLPPFPLFPWFFVLPGLFAVGFAIWGLRSAGKRGAAVAIIALGVGLIAAPAVFQMFSRAPKGAEMIDDFRSLMTDERVQTMQGYFLVIGAGEGNLRNDIVPVLSATDVSTAVSQFSDEWPRISNDMAPMIGAMGDNVDNYLGVDALPPFDLFPWFFVAPGVLLVVLGAAHVRRRPSSSGETAISQETVTSTQGES